MAVEWDSFRDEVRNQILKDADERNWDNEDLDVYAKWALQTFAAHTAKLRQDSWDCDGAISQFELPADIVTAPEFGGQVYTLTGTSKRYLDPIGYTFLEDRSAADGFWVWPENMLNLVSTPASGSVLYLDYFGYWDNPDTEDEDSMFDAPNWAHTALSYLIAAHAHSKYATRSASIRQWAENPERGSPEDNPLRVQSQYYYQMYEQELSRYPRQIRENFFRSA